MYKFNEIKQCKKCNLDIAPRSIFEAKIEYMLPVVSYIDHKNNIIYADAEYLLKTCPRCGWQWQEEVAEHENTDER